MTIDETKEAIKALPGGGMFVQNDTLDPLAVVPAFIDAKDLKALVDRLEALERVAETAHNELLVLRTVGRIVYSNAIPELEKLLGLYPASSRSLKRPSTS